MCVCVCVCTYIEGALSNVPQLLQQSVTHTYRHTYACEYSYVCVVIITLQQCNRRILKIAQSGECGMEWGIIRAYF